MTIAPPVAPPVAQLVCGAIGGAGLPAQQASGIPQILAPLGANWRGWWTTYDPTLPANPGVAFTDVGGNLEDDTWTDQRSNRVIQALGAGQRPPYAADGPNFSGLKAIQCSSVGVRVLVGNFASDLFVAGERPYKIVVCRARSPLTTILVPFSLSGLNGGDLNQYWFWGNSDQSYADREINETINAGASSFTQTTTIHSFGLRSGTTPRYRRVRAAADTTLFGGSSNQVLAGAVRRMTVGCNMDGAGTPSDVSYSEIFLFNDYPGDAIEAALIALLRIKWGI